MDQLGITYTPAVAGMFLWVDLSPLLATPTWEGEELLFEDMIREEKLVLTPGLSNHAESPGFFRICFAFNPLPNLREGMRRLESFVRRRKPEALPSPPPR